MVVKVKIKNGYKCTNCGAEFYDDVKFIRVGRVELPNFCPNCGDLWIEEEEEENHEPLFSKG